MSSASQGLKGLRVLSLESRRSAEMGRLIESHGGTAVSAPSMREIPIAENTEAVAFAEQLLGGSIDIVIFLTGVGTRILFGAIETRHARGEFVAALSRAVVVARGPKPVAVLREFGVPIHIAVPEPNTWRDVLKALEDYQPPRHLNGKRVAVQEYGVSNAEFLDGLRARGAAVWPVRVYQWALPDDLGPLRSAIRELAAGRIDVVLVTSATQVSHLMQVAAGEGLGKETKRGLQRAVIGSIGPISTQALEAYSVAADFEPSHPRMGQLVFEAAEKAANLLQYKRARS